MDLKLTYNRIAKDWANDHSDDSWWVNGTEKYVSFLPKGGFVLDVGCGNGEKSKYFADKGFKVTGVDFSEEMIKLAKSHVPLATFFVKDIKEPLKLENMFDGVFAQAVLLHMPKKEVLDVIKNMTTPLKPGGYLYIAVKETKLGEPEEQMVKESDYGYEYERFFSYFTLEEMENYLKQAGLAVVHKETTFSGKTNWIQIIAKK